MADSRGDSAVPAEEAGRSTRVWIATPASAVPLRVFGLTPEERLRRSLARDGTYRIHAGPKPPAAAQGEAVAVLRADVVYDERLVAALLETRDILLVTGQGEPAAARVPAERLEDTVAWLAGDESSDAFAARSGLRTAAPDDLVPRYTATLRKSQPPFALPLRPGESATLEKQLFASSYKGVTDLVTRFVWPAPALRVVRVLAARGVSPNSVTVASWILVAAATVAFAGGAYGVGLVAAWLMTFLDTVDGKLARVTLTSSRVGHVLDHGLDLVHPPIWYYAWGASLLAAAAAPAWIAAATWISVVGYVVGRAVEGIFLLIFGFEIHSWRQLDSRFRLVTARRNPNLILLTSGTLAGRPDLGLAAVAAWTVLCIGFHVVRLCMSLAERRGGGVVRGWQAGAA